MSLRERVRLLRKELCDEVIVELDRLEAEVASLRAQNELTHAAYVEENNRLMAEREALRAELAAVTSQRDEWQACYAAARQDAEEIARLKEDRTTELRNELEGIRSELKTTKRQSFVEGLNEAQRQYYPRVERLEATARQDAEEKARLREALILARREISDHDSDYHHRTRESTIEAIRAALACRPQGERSET